MLRNLFDFIIHITKNITEETNTILAAAQYLDTETILNKLPFLTPDEVDGILDRLTEEEAEMTEEVDDERNGEEVGEDIQPSEE